MAGGSIERLATGIHRWTAPHPEWRTSHPWGHEVASYVLEAEDATVLVDPLAPAGEAAEPFWSNLDRLVECRGAPIAVLITIHYHVRSAAEVAARYGGTTPVEVWAHAAIGRRLPTTVTFRPIRTDEPLPGGGRAFAIGKPKRQEQPLYFPSLRALAFGDSVVGVDGTLRVWQSVESERSERWYRERLLPTFRALLELEVDHVLPTHGPAVIGGGAEALARALEAPPWTTRQLRSA